MTLIRISRGRYSPKVPVFVNGVPYTVPVGIDTDQPAEVIAALDSARIPYRLGGGNGVSAGKLEIRGTGQRVSVGVNGAITYFPVNSEFDDTPANRDLLDTAKIAYLAGSAASAGDANRYMLASTDNKPYNKRNQVTTGLEYALSKKPITATAYGAAFPRVFWINWYLTEGGGSPVEDLVQSPRTILGTKVLFRGAYYQITFEMMRGLPGLTVSGDGTSIVIAPGYSCIADPLPFIMNGYEWMICETHDYNAIGDWRGGGTTVYIPRGESIEYSSTTLAGKLGNNSVLNNVVGGGIGVYTPGPAGMFGKGWDGRSVFFARGHSIWRGVGVTVESQNLRGSFTFIDRALADLNIPTWNGSVSGFNVKTLPGAGGLTGVGRSKALFLMLGNANNAMPFTDFGLPGDVNGKTTDETAWKQGLSNAWDTVRSEFPGVRLIQELIPPYTATTDVTYGATDQAHLTISASVSPTVWEAGGVRTRVNNWTLLQKGVGNGPDAIMDNRNTYSEDADFILARTDLSGASSPKMADGTLAVGSGAGANSILVTTTTPPAVGAFLLVGVGVAGADEMTVKRIALRPDIGANVWQVYAAGTQPTFIGTVPNAHPLGAVVKEEITQDYLHYSGNYHRYGSDKLKLMPELFSKVPAIIHPYQTETNDYFARLPVVPSQSDIRIAIDRIIDGARRCGYWDACDILYDLSAPEGSANINIRQNAFTLVKTGAVTFNNGVQGDGVSAWLNSLYNPTTAPNSKFLQDSAHGFVFCLSNINEDRGDMGHSTLTLSSRLVSGSMGGRWNGAGVGGIATSGSNLSSHGLNWANRVLSTGVGGNKNALTQTTATQTSVPVTSDTIKFLYGANGYSTKKLGFGGAGGGVTADMMEAMYNPIMSLMRLRGAM
jgi:hypothetical protein